jgi:DNA uptake protein ComE-like DNA-binding protein
MSKGLLNLANTAPLETLDDQSQVGLDVRAAENIVDTRQDGDFETLQQLDEVSWVSTQAFRKLYDYASENGYFQSSRSGDELYGVSVDSRIAEGMLELLNEADRQMLDDDVAPDARLARNIVEYKNSAGAFTSIMQLDEIYWLGQHSFNEIKAYPKENGYVDEPSDSDYVDHGDHAAGCHSAAGNARGVSDWQCYFPLLALSPETWIVTIRLNRPADPLKGEKTADSVNI